MAPCVDPGGVIIADSPDHTQTVRLHQKQVARDLTPEPESIYTYIQIHKHYHAMPSKFTEDSYLETIKKQNSCK